MADISIGIWKNTKPDGTICYNGTLPDGRKFNLYDNGPPEEGSRKPQFNLKIFEGKVKNVDFSVENHGKNDEVPF